MPRLNKADPKGWHGLTMAEERTLLAVCRHGSQKRAAHALDIHTSTVHSHMCTACARLKVDSQVHAALMYQAHRIANGLPPIILVTCSPGGIPNEPAEV
jgi:DNA-binding CsgD family transcriptional regulator